MKKTLLFSLLLLVLGTSKIYAQTHEVPTGPFLDSAHYVPPHTSRAKSLCSIPITHFEQCGQSWSGASLGTCTDDVCDAGCAMTDVTMLLAANGVSTDPGQLNTWLTNNGGYASGCDIYWANAANYPGATLTWYASVAFDLSTIQSELDAGNPVIVNVDHPYGGTGTCDHWVTIYSYSGNGTSSSDFLVSDPGSSTFPVSLSYYNICATNSTPLRIYHNVNGCGPLTSCTTPATPTQTDYNGATEGTAVTAFTLTPYLTWSNVGASCYYVYILDVDNGVLLATQGPIYTNSYSVPPGLLTDGTNYRWNLQADANCDGTCMSAYPSAVYFFTCNCPIAPAAASSISSSNGTTICSGQSTTLTPVGGSTGSCGSWVWYAGSCNSTEINMGSSLPVSPTSTTTYYVNPLDDCHNTYPACASITITVTSGTTPNATISSSNGISLCNGQSTQLSVQSCNGCTYEWSNSSTTYSTTVSTANTYYVTVTSSCGQSNYGNITINSGQTPNTPTFSLPTSGCNTLQITATSSLGCTYHWNGGNNINAQTNTFTSSGTYPVTATNSNGCTASASVNVTVNPAPSFTIAATNNNNNIFCSGQSLTLTASNNSFNYQWGNNATQTTSYTTTATPSGNQTYSATATNTNNCSSTASVNVTVNPVVTPTISLSQTPSGSICSDGAHSVTINANISNGGSSPQYSWSGCNGSSSGSQYPISNITAACTVSCTLTSDAQCASPTTATNIVNIDVTQPVTPTVNISSNVTTLCINSAVTFTTAITNAPNGVQPSSTTWYEDGGTQIGTGSPFIYNGWSSAGTHTITCTITYGSNACVTQSSINSTNTIIINVQTQAPAGLAIQGNSTNCQNAIDTFTAYPSNGGSSPHYQWMINSTAVGTNSSDFISSTLNNNDVVTCFITSNSTCAVPDTATSNNAITITVNANPTANAGSDTSVCAGSPVILNGAGNGSCFWQPTIALSDSTSCNPVCTTNAGRTYTLIITGSDNCTATSLVTISITSPSTPTVKDSITSITPITGKDSVIVCFVNTSINSTSVHWDFGDGSSSNSEAPCHVFNAHDAPYVVTLTAYNSCGNISDSSSSQFVTLGIAEISGLQNLTISPNPSSGSFTISFDANQGKEIQIKIYDLLGQLIHTEEPVTVSGPYTKQINLGNVAKGVYILQIQSGDGILNKKIEVN